ncbi:hypothetical protein AOQ84DRAFT_229397 [Glonium stellatum]|uniref:Uncharacterized protein n=1 Tax=Glonium stellatum TaxID=574774 RepID=A0A8E2EQ14_9PEZI|nr:hypothetical protein AOQ84DRAFT_229397 [Glonium stellatum]
MIMLAALTLLFDLSHLYSASANQFGSFISPAAADGQPDRVYTNDIIWPLESSQLIVWENECSNIDLVLWQQDSSLGGMTIMPPTTEAPKNYTWTVNTPGFDLTTSDVFFFWISCLDSNNQLISTDGQQAWFTSHYFNITQAEGASPTSSITQSFFGVAILSTTA